MRIVSDQPNTLRVQDNISGTTLELYYDNPTPKQHAGYTNGMTTRKRNKLVTCAGECRQKFGKQILTGIRDGDFAFKKADGKVQVVASDPNSENYRQDWKDWFCENNADLVDILARHAFEDSGEVDEPEGGSEDKENEDPNV